MLAPRGKFIGKALTVDMKVCHNLLWFLAWNHLLTPPPQEKKERVITFEGREPYIFEVLIYFAHHNDYDDQSGNDPDRRASAATLNAKVYALAEESQMLGIKPLVFEKLKLGLDKSPSRQDLLMTIKAVYETTLLTIVASSNRYLSLAPRRWNE